LISQFLEWSWELIVGSSGFHCIRAGAHQYIGVNYGEVADNLPPPEQITRLLKSTTISSKVQI
jgi:hypothetical protein